MLIYAYNPFKSCYTLKLLGLWRRSLCVNAIYWRGLKGRAG